MLRHEANKVHSPKPPCSCDDCLLAIHLAADQRRTEIQAILANLDALGLHITTADQMQREADHAPE